MGENDNALIVSKLDRIITLLVLNLIQGKGQEEQIRVLSKAGIQPKEIAEYIGTTANTVRVALVSIRKNKKRK